MSDNPWDDLQPPVSNSVFSAKRVDADHPWGFYWARSSEYRHILVLDHSQEYQPSERLPRLRGISIKDTDWQEEGSRVLIFALEDNSFRDIFLQLCNDIVSCSIKASSEEEAVSLSIARTWRWHHLLRGGTQRKLSPEEQKGLIGELLVLRRHALQNMSCVSAVESWKGPLGANKDFQIGRILVEVKTKRGAGSPFVKISSEYQLELPDSSSLYLYVCDIDRAEQNTRGAFTLSGLAGEIRDCLAGKDASAIDIYEQKLMAAGFCWEHDYSEDRWFEGAHRIYAVNETFPKINSGDLMPGVQNVAYSIALNSCEAHRSDGESLDSSIRGE